MVEVVLVHMVEMLQEMQTLEVEVVVMVRQEIIQMAEEEQVVIEREKIVVILIQLVL